MEEWRSCGLLVTGYKLPARGFVVAHLRISIFSDQATANSEIKTGHTISHSGKGKGVLMLGRDR